jgi:hypothetical protein
MSSILGLSHKGGEVVQHLPARILERGAMAVQMKKRLAALKHGAYSAMTVLPGESAAEFDQLHQQLICELNPNGVLETETVATLARLMWRKKNLSTFRIAEFARKRMLEIRETDEFGKGNFNGRYHAAERQARKELGVLCDLGEMGEAATFQGLANELEVHDRLDAMIDRCIKRLLMARGLKSMSISSPPAPPGRLDYLASDEK